LPIESRASYAKELPRGTGFIGSSLAFELCDENEVVIVDDCSTGSFENVREWVDPKIKASESMTVC